MKIKANVAIRQIPSWAILERQLFDVMEKATDPFLSKYTDEDGRLIWREGIRDTRDGADDFYESFYNWPLLYLLGGGTRLLELGQRQWDATTKLLEELGHISNEYEIGYDQFHQSESYIYFYLLCMADPSHEKNKERAQRFAGFYLNEDPAAINYDEEKNIIYCAHNGSKGPRWLYEEIEEVSYGYSKGMAVYGLPYEDVEGITKVEDLKDPENALKMGRVMKERMAKGDVATNLHVCSLIANAYLLTTDEKYITWLRKYVDGWIKRAEENDGFLPDNVGLSGNVGEYTGGKWYGSMYGWSWPHGLYNIAMAAIIAGVECYLFSGEKRYLELPRNQLRKVISQGKVEDLDELDMSLRHHWISQFRALGENRRSWVVPYRYSDSGWKDWQPLAPMYPLALWNVSGDETDREIVETIRENESYDWRKVSSFHTKEDAGHEQPWYMFIRGENPDYPEKILQASFEQVYRRLELIRQDETDPKENHIHWWQQLNPVTTEALIQLTLGAPQLLYNGGLLLAPLRYFDAQLKRPGLPQDVAALVTVVEKESLEIQLLNIGPTDSRTLIIQAGSLAEHSFTSVEYTQDIGQYPGKNDDYGSPNSEIQWVSKVIDNTHIEVDLPPGMQINLKLGLKRLVNVPSYQAPWKTD